AMSQTALADPPAPGSSSGEPGMFVIGDGSRVAGQAVEFWGAQLAKNSPLSGGGAPNSFKGFADIVQMTGPCNGTFETRPGNSSEPLASLSGDVTVLVANDVTTQ